jgi:signal transduction histidine kinase
LLRTIFGTIMLILVAPGVAAEGQLRIALVDAGASTSTIEQVIAHRQAFHAADSATPNFGYLVHPLWVRIDLGLLEPPRESWLIELAYTQADSIAAYLVADGKVIARASGGDQLPFSIRPLAHRYFVMPLAAHRATVYELYLHITTEGSLVLPIRAVRADRFAVLDGPRLLGLGLLFGLLASLVAYNACLYTVVRDPSYLYYVGYLASMSALQFTLHGLAQQYVWPRATGVGNAAVLILLAATLALGSAFVRNFLSAAGIKRNFERALAVSVILIVCFGVVGLVSSYRIGMQALIACAMGQAAVIAFAINDARRSGYRPARYLGWAFAALIGGGFLFVLRTYGLIAPTPVTARAFDLGVALEALLLSFALADRITVLEAQKRAAEAATAAARAGFAARLLERQQDDRRRIARALHDSLLQSLTATGLRLKRLAREATVPGRALDDAVLALREASTELREAEDDLHPHQVERLGFAQALQGVAQRLFGDGNTRCTFDIDSALCARLPARQAHELYRFTQEALANVAKHAAARHCEVSFTGSNARATLAISDDGIGMTDTAISARGLASMRERAALLGGECTVSTLTGGGTRVTLVYRITPA